MCSLLYQLILAITLIIHSLIYLTNFDISFHIIFQSTTINSLTYVINPNNPFWLHMRFSIIHPFLQNSLDLSVRAGGLNTDRVYTGSDKIRVGCISGSGEIRAGVFRFYGFRINPTSLERLFLSFFVKIKNSAYLLLKIISYSMKKYVFKL